MTDVEDHADRVVAAIAETSGRELDDIARAKQDARQTRLTLLAIFLGGIALLLLIRDLYRAWGGEPLGFGMPAFGSWSYYLPGIVLVAVLFFVLVMPMVALGRSPDKEIPVSSLNVSSEDILGSGEVRIMIRQLISEYRNFSRLETDFGSRAPQAVLFEGPPGTGKTMAAKAIAKEANVPFLFASGTSFQAMYYGQSGKKVRSFFRRLRKLAYKNGGAIGFIDEFDAIGVSRSSSKGSGHDTTASVVGELLVQLQSVDHPFWFERFQSFVGLRKDSGPMPRFLLLAATNRGDELDPALVRPGRFDRRVTFDLPSFEDRRLILTGIFKPMISKGKCSISEDAITQVASYSSGMSQASLVRVAEEAGIEALHEQSGIISDEYLLRSFAKVALGRSQRSPYSDREKMAISVHEAGHAVYRYFNDIESTIGVVSILKRGKSLGLTASYRANDSHITNKTQLLIEIETLLSGMIAEEIVLGDVSSGSSSDLTRATDIALSICSSFGMGESLISIPTVSSSAGISLLMNEGPVRSEVNRILNRAKERSRSSLEEHSDLLWRVSLRLCEVDEIDQDGLVEILGPRAESENAIDLNV